MGGARWRGIRFTSQAVGATSFNQSGSIIYNTVIFRGGFDTTLGVLLIEGAHPLVENVTFSQCAGRAVRYLATAISVELQGVTVRGNDHTHSVFLESSSTICFSRACYLSRLWSEGNNDYAVYMSGFQTSTSPASFLIRDSTFYNLTQVSIENGEECGGWGK